MKKALILFMALLLIPSMINLTVLAAEAESRGATVQMDEEIIAIFNDQIKEEAHILRDPSYYISLWDVYHDERLDDPKYDIKERPITDQPIIPIYQDYLFLKYPLGFQDVVEICGDESFYIVVEEEPYFVCCDLTWENKPFVTIWEYMDRYDPLPTYMVDLINLKSNTEILGKQCKIVNVVCIEIPDPRETVIYLVTDQGIYVKYYENYTSDSLVFTEYDFIELSKEYVEARGVYYSYNWSTLAAYLRDLNETEVGGTEAINTTTKNIQNNKDDPDSKSRNESASEWLWAIIPAAAVVGIISEAVTYVFMRKKSK